MASATKKILIPPPPPPTDYEVVLTLTSEEAEHLFRLVGSIAGPTTGPRGIFNRIYEALDRAETKSLDQYHWYLFINEKGEQE